ncbi:hypothetical protein LSAT2_023283 [Lamellibrachia satsuma]|nr:hypothetical protein LSAT2_023283 [Lamellibrachia satsuma]
MWTHTATIAEIGTLRRPARIISHLDSTATLDDHHRKHDYDCGAGITAAVDTTSLKAAGRNTMTRTGAIEHRKDHGVDSHRPLEMTVGGTTGVHMASGNDEETTLRIMTVPHVK